MKETWKLLPKHPHIAVSSHGRVVALARVITASDGVDVHIRSRLVSIGKTGAFAITGDINGYLPTIYRKLFRRKLNTRPWPVKGRYLS